MIVWRWFFQSSKVELIGYFSSGDWLFELRESFSFSFNFCHFFALLCSSLFLNLEYLFSKFSYSFRKPTWWLSFKIDSISTLILAITLSNSNNRSCTRFFCAWFKIVRHLPLKPLETGSNAGFLFNCKPFGIIPSYILWM